MEIRGRKCGQWSRNKPETAEYYCRQTLFVTLTFYNNMVFYHQFITISNLLFVTLQKQSVSVRVQKSYRLSYISLEIHPVLHYQWILRTHWYTFVHFQGRIKPCLEFTSLNTRFFLFMYYFTWRGWHPRRERNIQTINFIL